MGLRIVYGKSGSGKSQFCFDEIANLIHKEKKIYIITPEQFSFTAEKKLMESIKQEAILNAEVITLSRMAYRVMQEIGGIKKKTLTKSGKAMIIYHILNQYKKQLKFLSKSNENIDISISAITELKKHGISIKDLKEEINKCEDKYLTTKIQDILLVYEKFEERILSQYIEETDLLTLLARDINKTDIIKDSIIYIDEFSGFTNQEYEVIKEFIRIAKQVTITICSDSLEMSQDANMDIFFSNKKTIFKLIDIVNRNDFKLEKPVYLSTQPRFKEKELAILEKNLYSKNPCSYINNVENIKLFLAKNQYSEIDNVSKEIVKLVRDFGFRYKDISIITNNLDTYSNLIRAIFKQYDIPVFIDEKRELTQNVIVQYILSIIEIFVKNFSNEAIFNYLKVGFFNIEADDIFKLENYCTKWGIKQNKWKVDFTYGINEKTKEDIKYLNELRKKIINPLLELKANFNNCKNIVNALYNFLQQENIEQKINEKIEELTNEGFIDLANEYIASYKIILDLFDEIVLIFGEEKISIDKFYQILKTGLKNSKLGKIPTMQDQVIVGDVERSRTHKVQVIFIIGLNDGNFPNVNKTEGFFGDKDREILKSDGLELANGTLENLYEENFNIYKAFSTAERKLYLSYSSSELEGKPLRKSMILNKIKRIFVNLKETSDIINKQYEVTNKLMTYEELLKNISILNDGKNINELWYVVYEYYKNQNEWKEKLERELKAITYTNIPKTISKQIIEKLYGNTLNTSISKLEKYSQCAFSYYLEYGLRLKDKEELKVQSFDTGSFMHEIIDDFFKTVKEQKIELPRLLEDDEYISKLINNIIGEKLEIQNRYIFTLTAKYKVLVKRLKKIIVKAIKYIIEGLVYSKFDVKGTEVEFGKNVEYNPITIQLDNGKKVEIIGKIDRIDTAISDDGKYLRIIDYKSSAKNIDLNEVYAGLQIQLLTYIDAVCKEEDLIPAGVLYFSLLEQMISTDKKITEEEIEEELRKNFRMKGLILADIKVIKMHDKTLTSGTSKLVPAALTTSGEVYESRTNGVTKEEFKILQDYIYKTIKEISKEILSGKIDLKPYNKKGKTPCEYCAYKTICGFNIKNYGNTYNYIEKKSKDDIISDMKTKI